MHLFNTAASLIVACSAIVARAEWSSDHDTNATIWKDIASISSRSPPASRITKRQSTWSPPSNLVTPLKQVWDHEMSTYSNPLGFKNYGYDQIMANKGYINYCVRWDSSATVTGAQRTKIAQVLQAQHDKWMRYLFNFMSFPYTSVPITVVGWAVRDKAQLQGSTSNIQVYTNKDSAGIPECDPACGRFFHQNGVYSGCAAGASRHYDVSLWLTDGFSGGAGGDWGQRIGQEYFMSNLNTENVHILLHEMGHTYALDDFYDWTPSGVAGFVMKAGSATQITEFDGWMMRDWWRNLKSRYEL